jgi:NodT family efflux transporter outer membrane factor (OMF) lipoprotein
MRSQFFVLERDFRSVSVKKMMEYSLVKSTHSMLIVLTALTVLGLSACAVGPNFKSPEPIATSETFSYSETPIDEQTVASTGKSGASQKLVMGQDIPAQWWELFQSEELDALIRSALANSPDLASAQAALRQSQELYRAFSGNAFFPKVDANFSPERDKSSTAVTGNPEGRFFNLFNASVSVSYTIDAFGANRRGAEDLEAEIENQRFLVEAAYLTLTSNVVTTAIKEASLRAQLEAQNEILVAQEKQLEIIKSRFITGAISKVDVLTQQGFVAQTRAAIPPLEKAIQQTRHQLAVLAGRLPSDSNLPTFNLDTLNLPEELPVSIPSALVRQRPDIRSSEAQLHRASAQIGVATANQYPQITLTGTFGSTATTMGTLFTSPAEMWRLAGSITQPIFNAGSLSAKRRAALAFYDQQDAKYRSTVLSAFQNVADSLQALEFDAKTLKEQVEVVEVAKHSLDLANLQFGFGSINSITLLDAKRTYQLARINLVLAQAARYSDTVALFQSLGGGWWNRTELKDISIKE